MEKEAMHNLTYGVLMLSTKLDNKFNGCIIDTCIQVANEPARVAISVGNHSYTCELIKESGIFAVSIIDETASFDTIKHFGYQSGREVDKFANMTPPLDINGVPYMGWQACSVISCHVEKELNLGTHTLFIGKIDEAKLLNDEEPLFYAHYQKTVKR